MKILYLSGGEMPDYQCDMLFHGLRELLGPEVVDARRLWYMYRSEVTPEIKQRLYGRGFTVYGRLGEVAVDREDLRAKVEARYFDYVIYGSAWRNLDGFDLVRRNYPASRIAFIDGEDGPMLRGDLLGLGLYFKRECTRAMRQCLPIGFAIPKDAVRRSVPAKTKALATVIPGRLETYVFDDEQAYYDDYATSMVAITTKKAGWDCLRHYEILANGCVPHFIDLEKCPSHTLTALPKRFLLKARRWPAVPTAICEDTFEACRRFTAEHLTTEALALRFLDAMRSGRSAVRMAELAVSPPSAALQST